MTAKQDREDKTSEELPFKCEWEIGVHPAGYPDDWSHYHPQAKTEEKAQELAKEKAKDDGMNDPMIYMTTGPFKPQDPIRVGEEMIESVFGGI